MLSFLQEQRFEDSSAQKQPDVAGDISSDSPEKTQEQEYLAVAVQDKDVRKSTYLLAILFGIGLLCLWFMIKRSTPTAAVASVGTEESQIETAISRLTGVRTEMFSRMDEMVKKFYEFSDVQQVKVNDLAKNPFSMDKFLGGLNKISDTKKGNPDKIQMMSKERMREQTNNMHLLSIMQSERGNCCMINDEILYEGDSIKGFRIAQIGNNIVELEWYPKTDKEHLGNESEALKVILKLLE